MEGYSAEEILNSINILSEDIYGNIHRGQPQSIYASITVIGNLHVSWTYLPELPFMNFTRVI